jgi:hypothetical protein
MKISDWVAVYSEEISDWVAVYSEEIISGMLFAGNLYIVGLSLYFILK